MFVAVFLAANVAAGFGLAYLLTALAPLVGGFAAVTLLLITSVGWGALTVFLAAVVGVWLAERGWFV